MPIAPNNRKRRMDPPSRPDGSQDRYAFLCLGFGGSTLAAPRSTPPTSRMSRRDGDSPPGGGLSGGRGPGFPDRRSAEALSGAGRLDRRSASPPRGLPFGLDLAERAGRA